MRQFTYWEDEDRLRRADADKTHQRMLESMSDEEMWQKYYSDDMTFDEYKKRRI